MSTNHRSSRATGNDIASEGWADRPEDRVALDERRRPAAPTGPGEP